MKYFKYVFCFCLLMFFTSSVYAKEELALNAEAIYSNNQFTGINYSVVIPEDTDSDIITIHPDIFGELGKYTTIMPGDRLLFNLDVENLSHYDYQYVDGSFSLTTKKERKPSTISAFDGYGVDEEYYPYRTVNSALKALLGNNVSKSKVSDEVIDQALKERNYLGIDSLYQYYEDFYGKDISTNYDLMMKVFSGNRSNYKETNLEIIALSFNYFYQKLLSYSFQNDVVTDINSEDYSIAHYMGDNSYGDEKFKEQFAYLTANSSSSLNDMSININGLYTVNAYMNYSFAGDLSFQMKKVTKEVPAIEEKDLELIPAPNTGI